MFSTVSFLNWCIYFAWIYLSPPLAHSQEATHLCMLLFVCLNKYIFEILSFTILVYFSLGCSYVSFLLWEHIEQFIFTVRKKEVCRWASRSLETLWTFMQNLYMSICGENPSISKILRELWETKEHKLLLVVWTVHGTQVPHVHRPTQLHQRWLFCPLQVTTVFPSTKNWANTDLERCLLSYRYWGLPSC